METEGYKDYLSSLSKGGLNQELWSCADNGALEDAARCLEHGASAKSKFNGERATALIRAAVRGHAEMVRFLIPVSNMNDVDSDGNTAVGRCCEEAQPQCLNELIAAGADLNKPNKSGDTPIFLAMRYGAHAWSAGQRKTDESARCLDLLIPRCDLSVKNMDGQTPLDITRQARLTVLLGAMEAACLAKEEKAALEESTPKRGSQGKRSKMGLSRI